MKVIHIMDNLSARGGVNSFVYDLCYALKEQGCDVSLIGILNKGVNQNPEVELLRAEGIRVECINLNRKKEALICGCCKLRKVIKSIAGGEQTVCNLHLKLSVLMGVLATRGIENIKCVETYHNTYHHYHLQCWFCSLFIRKYITVSDAARKEMHDRFFLPYGRIISIPNGVSRKKIREMAKIEEYKPEDGKIRIVSVGRLSYEKNFKVPVEAFAGVCNEHMTYTLVGGGPQEEEIRIIAAQNPYIRMTGALTREETLRELGKADVVVLPSLWEGRSILQMEALALDKPMIISDVPGLREPFKENALREGEIIRVCDYGFLVETSSLEAYKMAVEHLRKNEKSVDYSVIRNISEQNDMQYVAKAYAEQYVNSLKG